MHEPLARRVMEFDQSASHEQEMTSWQKAGRFDDDNPEGIKLVTLRLPSATIDYFKAAEPGWQTRAIDMLEREVRHARKAPA